MWIRNGLSRQKNNRKIPGGSIMHIIRKTFGEMDNNCYILFDRDGGEAYIIDPGYEAKKIEAVIRKHRLCVQGILATHHHYDHTDACEQLRKDLGTCVFMSGKDAKHYKGTVDRLLSEGDVLKIGEEVLRVIETPGHTDGGLSFLCDTSKCIFTGDTLFSTDTGYAIFETGSPDDMERSVKKISTLLSDDYVVWPGHEENATMAFIRRHNRDFMEYVQGIHPAHTKMDPESVRSSR